jgi:hypothetical protein
VYKQGSAALETKQWLKPPGERRKKQKWLSRSEEKRQA